MENDRKTVYCPEGIVVAERKLRKRFSFAKHNHDYFELELIIRGSGTITVNDASYSFSEKMIYLLTPAQVHSIASEEVELFTVMIEHAEIPLPLLLRQEPLISLTDEQYLFFYQLIDKLVSVHKENPIYAKHLFHCVLFEMLSCIDGLNTPEQSYISTAIQYLLENFRSDITLESTARRLGLSPSYFSALFFQQIGVHFKEYLDLLRFSYACSLLTSSNAPIGEVCAQSGFSDYANFSRRFKQKYGVSPREFRKEKQEA